MDVLTDVLSTLRLQGTVYFQADFCAPWGMDIKGGAVANFHLVVEGQCWLKIAVPDGESICQLNQGDIVVMPQGHRHALLHAPDAEAPPAESVIGQLDLAQSPAVYDGPGEATTLICGHYEYDRAGRHPLLKALPALIHLKKSQQTQWTQTASQLTVLESGSNQDGSSAVINRLAEVLLIQVIRAYAQQLDDKQGFIATLAEPALATALSLLHGDPAKPWQLSELAKASGVSRTVLTDRFNHLLGIAPIQYLTQWRMHKAREMLVTRNQSIAQIAEQVGYSSEWSFSKAYKRVFNEGPGATRQHKTH